MDTDQSSSVPYNNMDRVSESLSEIKRWRSSWMLLAVGVFVIVVFGIMFIVIFVLISQLSQKTTSQSQLSDDLSQINESTTPLALQLSGNKVKSSNDISIKTQVSLHQGWYSASNGYLYKKINTTQDYTDAVKACQKSGARLAATGVRDSNIRKQIFDVLLDSPEKNVWIGLVYFDGKWAWSDGVIAAFNDTNWAPGEPNNSGNHKCAELWGLKNWRLADGKCTTPHPYLCEVLETT
ncbi:uncharacterized protein LOC120332794 isoform X1 [Styela clava]